MDFPPAVYLPRNVLTTGLDPLVLTPPCAKKDLPEMELPNPRSRYLIAASIPDPAAWISAYF